MPVSDFQVGEPLTLACEPADARVATVWGRYIFIEWPWRQIDPESRVRWNGQVALPREADSGEWANTPWRVEPAADELAVGDSCRVGIPRTRVVVRAVRIYRPAKDVGWLPRPTVALSVVPFGDCDGDEEAGYLVHVDGAEPITAARAQDFR
ncbi:hypothetical protein [Actinacidiphila guanduensis]|uniref:Uncharacterized protein n=1 Tax=Actinacidiphila guanduensis TaxID=310781 RepID=A0A1H0DYB3_9ACTN|nr:hypothetical protein [Actinacidiphila guanduensis]SDN75150.1 hypothetical protein SAMN05216259_105402 [Actinacidiphila guanduensis]